MADTMQIQNDVEQISRKLTNNVLHLTFQSIENNLLQNRFQLFIERPTNNGKLAVHNKLISGYLCYK
jgi:hypothetical protein